MDTNIFVYGIGVIMSLMVISLAGMAWRKRQPVSSRARTNPVTQTQPTTHT